MVIGLRQCFSASEAHVSVLNMDTNGKHPVNKNCFALCNAQTEGSGIITSIPNMVMLSGMRGWRILDPSRVALLSLFGHVHSAGWC